MRLEINDLKALLIEVLNHFEMTSAGGIDFVY